MISRTGKFNIEDIKQSSQPEGLIVRISQSSSDPSSLSYDSLEEGMGQTILEPQDQTIIGE